MIYNVTEYGIIGDGITNNTAKINELTKLASQKGGVIYFPAGEYVTGTVFLYSNMTLHIDSGALLLGSDNHDDFPMIEVEGYTRGGHWGIISALDAENVAVIGNGKIDGRGYYWWKSGKSDLVRPRTVNFIKCKNVKIADITIVNSPCWSIHPMCCENVTVRSVSIFNPYNSPNTDGVNPESCKNVRISDCHIDVGDDCITIKSGTEDDLLQKQFPCENIIVSNCTLAHGHGGVVFGSEMSGGISNVTVSNCVFQNTDRGIRIKTRRMRGGYVKGLTVNNLIMENVIACVTINEYYSCGLYTTPKEILFDTGKQPVTELTPIVSDVRISGIIARDITGVGIYIYGLPELPIKNVSISDVQMQVKGSEKGVTAVAAPGNPKVFGEGIMIRNAEGISMSNISISDCPSTKLFVENSTHVTLNGEDISRS
ncbi:MAG: glycoside hydrolase family 28 protein [Clostridia bacterium]|nr:glycoside hydrolase family 28 protein [Clostridia bacterium]